MSAEHGKAPHALFSNLPDLTLHQFMSFKPPPNVSLHPDPFVCDGLPLSPEENREVSTVDVDRPLSKRMLHPLERRPMSADLSTGGVFTTEPAESRTPEAAPPAINLSNDTEVEDANESAFDKDVAKDEIAIALEKRNQPLMELVYSEESYVRKLRIVYELYMPAAYRTPPNSSDSTSSTSPSSPMVNSSATVFEELASKLPPGGPTVPDDLVARWRILWGNWLQLYEWHTGFYEKLKTLVKEDPDRIPKLLIDSRARLRSIYSKYCENQIKAAHIAEQHKEFFDEWRLHVSDKEDVLSLLMQPVQRIMRYQLPISEIVKWTERAQLSSLPQWQKAHDIMKEIPKDTQLILEAARIDGFPGVITALGTLRIRGDLLVASVSRSELADALSAYTKALNLLPSPTLHSGTRQLTNALLAANAAKSAAAAATATAAELAPVDAALSGDPASRSPKAPLATATSTPGKTTDLPDTTTLTTTGPPSPSPVVSPLPVGEANVSTESASPSPPLKFTVSRLFLFDRMLLVTEEVKGRRRGGGAAYAEAFAQSTYQFKAAINVNKMRFEPHWFLCNPADAEGKRGNTLEAVVRSALEIAASDDLRFALWDQTPGRDVFYIVDPQTVATRSAWVVHLRDIQRMQQQLLMALEDPTRFANTGSANEHWGTPTCVASDEIACHSTSVKSISKSQQSAAVTAVSSQPHQRKWPSFNMRRPARLSSTSSTGANMSVSGGPNAGAPQQLQATSASGSLRFSAGGKSPHKSENLSVSGQATAASPPRTTNLLRSYSAERNRDNHTSPASVSTPQLHAAQHRPATLQPSSTCRVVPANKTRPPSSKNPSHRKSSDGCALDKDDLDGTVEDCQRELAGFQKTKKVLSSLFGKHKKARQQPSIPPLHPHSKKRSDTISDTTSSPATLESVMSTSCHAALPNESTGSS
ncbi:hypothetical protein SprV_0401422400 [Sparganum proliferum]